MNALLLPPAAAVLALCCTLASQTPPGFSPAEAAAMSLQEQGRFGAARDALLDLLTTTPPATERERALLEYFAARAAHVAEACGDRAGVRRAIATAVARAAGHPMLVDTLTRIDLELALATDDAATVGRATMALGFVTAWWVIGPFDNERGAGFATKYAPESAIDLDATYDGKKRPVAWRQLPIAGAPAGLIDLDALVRPNDQVLCYLLTLVHSDLEQPALLRLGSDEAVKVFHNGTEVLARDVRRPFAFDQDAVALRLRRGANLILVKVCDQEGEFACAARLTRPDGGPLSSIRISDAADQVRAAASTWGDGRTPRATAGEQLEPGARGFFQSALEQARLAQAENGPDAYRLGLLYALAKADDPNGRRDRELATQAVAELPGNSSARMLLAHTRVQPILHAAEREESARRFDYEAILATEPGHARALWQLAVMDLDSVGAAGTAEARLRTVLASNQGFALARVELARALRQLRLDVLADRELLAAALVPDGENPALLAQVAEVLRRREDHAGAAAMLVRAQRLDATDGRRAVSAADEMLRAGQRDAAIALLTRCQDTCPFAREPRLRLARLLRGEGKLDAAIATLTAWLAICPEDDQALLELATAHGIAGRIEPQRELLRRALELNKNLRNERRLLDFLETEAKPFYEAHRIDGDAVITTDAGPPADAAAKNDALHYLLDQTMVHAYRNGTTSEYQHLVVRILNEEGAKQMARHFVRHYYGEQRARLLGARIVKKDGTVVRPKLNEYYVDLPSLAAGDVVDIEQRVDDLSPSFFGDYFGLEHQLSRGEPAARSLLTVELEPGREYRFQERGGAPAGARETLADGTVVVRWDMHDVPRIDYEELQPDWKEVAPLVRVTTYADWGQFSHWWWNLVRKQTEVTPAMRDKVRELTAGASSPAEKLAAVYHFVTTDVRYTAWEFGVHGYKPYSTPAIFERRHGDCKDKALLLNALLSVVGIEAFPVLIFADDRRSTDDLSLPLVGHFNHCISFMPAQQGLPDMFLDGTATYHPSDTLPAMDRGAQVLVVRAGEAELRAVPWTDPNENADVETYTIDLTATGDAKVQHRHTPLQNQAVWVRQELGNEPAKQREKLERWLTTTLGKAQIDAIKTSDLLDLGTPVEVVIDATAQDFAGRQDGGLVLRSTLRQSNLMSITGKAERTYPLVLGTPSSSRTRLRYRLPAGFAPTSLPEPTEIRSRFGSFSLTWSLDAGELVVDRALTYATPRIEPAEYPAFRDFAAAVDRAESTVVLVKPNGGGR